MILVEGGYGTSGGVLVRLVGYMDYFNESLWESYCSNTIRALCISPRVVEIRIPHIDLF